MPASTVALYNLIRNAFLPVIPAVYIRKVPTDGEMPYAVLRIFNVRQMGVDGSVPARSLARLEIMVYHRGDNNAQAVEDYGDTIQAVLAGARWLDSEAGLVFAFRCDQGRDTIQAQAAEIDSDVITLRMVYTFVWWPAFLAGTVGAPAVITGPVIGSAPTTLKTLVNGCGGRVLANSVVTGCAVAYDSGYNTVRSNGIIQSVGDAYGTGPGLGGILRPQKHGIGIPLIQYDEVNQLWVFDAAHQTVLTGTPDPQINLGASAMPWWMIIIGTVQNQAYVAIADNAAGSQWVSVGIDVVGPALVWGASTNSSLREAANSLVPVSALRRLVMAQFVNQISHQIEVRAQAPVLWGEAAEGPWAFEPLTLSLGGFNGGFGGWITGDIRTFLMGPGTLTPTMRGLAAAYATTSDGIHANTVVLAS